MRIIALYLLPLCFACRAMYVTVFRVISKLSATTVTHFPAPSPGGLL